MNKLITTIVFLAFSQVSLAETVLKATYTLKWGTTTIGNVKRKLEKTGGIYTFTSVAKPRGLAVFLTKGISEKSVFKLQGTKIIPISYDYDQRGKKSKVVHHQYNWGTKTLKITKPTSVTVKNINPNTVDALNSQYMVMLGLANGQNNFNVAIYDDSVKPKVYGLQNGGNIKIKTPAGGFDTVLVRKTQAGKKKFNLWCAPKLNYLPVKISYINKKGQTFTMELVSVD